MVEPPTVFERIAGSTFLSRRASAAYAAGLLVAVGVVTIFGARLRLVSGGFLTSGHLASVASNGYLSPGERIGALGALQRADPERAVEVARDLMKSEPPDLRLTAATIVARAGYPTGQQVLLGILRDRNLSLGYRGMAARRLASVHSLEAHPLIVGLAKQQVSFASRGLRQQDDIGFRWSLLTALGRYRKPEDLDVALDLYRATGLRAPARAIGMFGRPEALPVLRDALPLQENALWTLQIELAIARSGGDDGVRFVRELLRRGGEVGALAGEIDLRTEDPLSGRLTEHVLRDLGAHSSDRQFFRDVLAIQRPTVCSFCGSAWSALARLGTSGHEPELLELAARLGKGRSDQAIQVLAYNGEVVQARELAKRMGSERSAEISIAAHEKGNDRAWFPLTPDNWD